MGGIGGALTAIATGGPKEIGRSANLPVPVRMPRSSRPAWCIAAAVYGSNVFSHGKAHSLPQST